MKSTCDKKKQLLEYARDHGIVSSGEVRAQGIHHEYLRQLTAEGTMVRVGRGRYTLADAEVTAHYGLAQTAKVVPKGVICLLSALRFHEIGTQIPFQVWVAIDRRAARPQSKHPKMHIVRFSGEALSEGIEEHNIDGVLVRIYSPAKTVADCFKYRNKIGLDVAIEALREGINKKKCTMDELWYFAKICRVTNTIRPYMEALV